MRNLSRSSCFKKAQVGNKAQVSSISIDFQSKKACLTAYVQRHQTS